MMHLSPTKISVIAVMLLAAVALVLNFHFHLLLPELLASISLLLVLFIALVQQIHLKRLETIGKETAQTARRLETIGKETAETANRIRTDVWLEENTKDFFGVLGSEGKRYECVFPVQFEGKPLPLINAGDYHGLHVLNSRLGSEYLELNMCQRGDKAAIHGNNVILLCAPDANPIAEDLFKSSDMPCWIEPINGMKQMRVSEINSRVGYLPSDSERFYAEAKQSNPTQIYQMYKNQESFDDYGILARKTDGDKRYVLIAGIHQPGTWIVAEYLDRLLMKQRDKSNPVLFFEPYDFAVVIWGTVAAPRLKVVRMDIAKDYCWQRRNGKWGKVRPPRSLGHDSAIDNLGRV